MYSTLVSPLSLLLWFRFLTCESMLIWVHQSNIMFCISGNAWYASIEFANFDGLWSQILRPIISQNTHIVICHCSRRLRWLSIWQFSCNYLFFFLRKLFTLYPVVTSVCLFKKLHEVMTREYYSFKCSFRFSDTFNSIY